MLIEFSVANFRSFRERQTLSLVATQAKELASKNTFSTRIKSIPPLLRSAAIFGPNAGGKTNLFRAVHFMQQAVLTSAVAGQLGQKLNAKPFALSRKTRHLPSEFEIKFIQDGVLYEYGLACTESQVVREWLVAYPSGRPQRWFDRSYSDRTKKTIWTIGTKLKGAYKLWRDATRPNALFLSTAVQLNNEQLKPIFNWFKEKLTIVVPGVELNPYLTFNLATKEAGKSIIMQFLKAADLGISDISVKREPFNPQLQTAQQSPIVKGQVFVTSPGTFEAISASMLHHEVDSKGFVDWDYSEESDGTQKFFRSIGGWHRVLSLGATVFVDELDSSLHPKIVRFLIDLFQSSETNKHNAQLIFNTHDTSILSNDVFRRDQIWFAEKSKTQNTKLYSMSEFSPRKGEAFAKHYLSGRYGAIPILGEVALNG